MKISQRIKKIVPFITKSSIKSLSLCPSNSALVCRINDDFILKVPLDEDCRKNLEKEIEISHVLNQHNLPVKTPDWQKIDLPTDLTAAPYNPPICAISPVLSGISPTHVDTPELALDLGLFLSHLHRLPIGLFPPMLSSIENMFNLELRMLNILGYKISQGTKKHLKNTVFSSINTLFHHLIQPVLCHHDLHTGNLLINRDGRLCGVLDFGCARIANRSCDLKLITPYQSDSTKKILLDTYKQNIGKQIDFNTANTQETQLILKMKTDLAIALKEFQNQRT
ncbi:MAG: aminoglycoside phosphotransferase family protein [Alphaproteobacteria bacterium]|nr:aminoglycoside phosphotransferase family protein [Alphaproteobacteria bacterium]